MDTTRQQIELYGKKESCGNGLTEIEETVLFSSKCNHSVMTTLPDYLTPRYRLQRMFCPKCMSYLTVNRWKRHNEN